jgi:hypothetical protein
VGFCEHFGFTIISPNEVALDFHTGQDTTSTMWVRSVVPDEVLDDVLMFSLCASVCRTIEMAFDCKSDEV